MIFNYNDIFEIDYYSKFQSERIYRIRGLPPPSGLLVQFQLNDRAYKATAMRNGREMTDAHIAG